MPKQKSANGGATVGIGSRTFGERLSASVRRPWRAALEALGWRKRDGDGGRARRRSDADDPAEGDGNEWRRHLGRQGEALAESHLRGLGMRLITRNFRVPGGEIDLVMMDRDGTVVCVEVKTRVRRNATAHPGEHAITSAKSRRMARSALIAARQQSWGRRPLRLDVVAIDIFPPDHGAAGAALHVTSEGGVDESAPVIRHHRGIEALAREH